MFKQLWLQIIFTNKSNVLSVNRPEVKANKEGADTEKAAEQSAEEELVKEKVVEEKVDENKEKEAAAQ